jgi:hypothetical protein
VKEVGFYLVFDLIHPGNQDQTGEEIRKLWEPECKGAGRVSMEVR